MPPRTSAADDHVEVRLLIERVDRLCHVLEGNGTPGIVQRITDTERLLVEVATRQNECPARRRRWGDIILVACAIIAAVIASMS